MASSPSALVSNYHRNQDLAGDILKAECRQRINAYGVDGKPQPDGEGVPSILVDATALPPKVSYNALLLFASADSKLRWEAYPQGLDEASSDARKAV